MTHREFFERMTAAVNAGDMDHIAEWFTEDFRLHEPGFDVPVGHLGAEAMLRALRRPGARMKIEILDVIEAGNRAAVRWLFLGQKDGQPVCRPCIAMYRFEGGRIAEDWGITSTLGPWP